DAGSAPAHLARRGSVGSSRPSDGRAHRLPHFGATAATRRVNALDAIVLLAIALAAWTGYRHGFTARALAWVGLIIGIVIGVLFVDDIADALKGSTSQTRLI